MVAAGLLNERVAFQTKTESVTTAGIVSSTWATGFTVWGRIKQEDGRSDEAGIGDRPLGQTKLTLIVRHRDDITTGMRVQWRSRNFEITGKINRDERREMLDLLIIERKST